MLADDCYGQVRKSIVLNNSNSESESSENDLSVTANRIGKPTVIQIIRNWTL